MNYMKWIKSFLSLIILIVLFYMIGGRLINLIIVLSLIAIIEDLLKEHHLKIKRLNK